MDKKITDSIIYIGVDDKDIVYLRASMLFQTVFHTTHM